MTTTKKENPLINILVNLIIPITLLTALSKEEDKFYHIGPMYAMILSVLIPFSYGIWHYFSTRKIDIFSVLGTISILLTGSITYYIWQGNDAVKAKAALFFGIKEALLPFIFSILFLITYQTKKSLLNIFFYNDNLFNKPFIEEQIKLHNQQQKYRQLLWHLNLLFSLSFLISAVLNIYVAYLFLGDLTPDTANWKIAYNIRVAKITGWGFVILGLPLIVFIIFTLFYSLRKLRYLTGLSNTELLHIKTK